MRIDLRKRFRQDGFTDVGAASRAAHLRKNPT